METNKRTQVVFFKANKIRSQAYFPANLAMRKQVTFILCDEYLPKMFLEDASVPFRISTIRKQ